MSDDPLPADKPALAQPMGLPQEPTDPAPKIQDLSQNLPPPVGETAVERTSQTSGNQHRMAGGELSKARDIIAAIRTLKEIEQQQRQATPDEKQILHRFSGFGPVALSIFPNPVTGHFKDKSWQAIGEELKSLVTPEEYDSAKRTTFNAFYTSPVVIDAIHAAVGQLGVPSNGVSLEPAVASAISSGEGVRANGLSVWSWMRFPVDWHGRSPSAQYPHREFSRLQTA